MSFGKRTDLATGRQLDFDVSYNVLIKPVVEEKGLACVRVDEISHSGVIDLAILSPPSPGASSLPLMTPPPASRRMHRAMADAGASLRPAVGAASAGHGDREAARVLARIVGAIVEHGEAEVISPARCTCRIDRSARPRHCP
jgi:hypothetical protein